MEGSIQEQQYNKKGRARLHTRERMQSPPVPCVCVSCGQKQKCSIAKARPRYILEAVKIRSLLIHRPALGASRKLYIVCDMRRFNQHMCNHGESTKARPHPQMKYSRGALTVRSTSSAIHIFTPQLIVDSSLGSDKTLLLQICIILQRVTSGNWRLHMVKLFILQHCRKLH